MSNKKSFSSQVSSRFRPLFQLICHRGRLKVHDEKGVLNLLHVSLVMNCDVRNEQLCRCKYLQIVNLLGTVLKDLKPRKMAKGLIWPSPFVTSRRLNLRQNTRQIGLFLKNLKDFGAYFKGCNLSLKSGTRKFKNKGRCIFRNHTSNLKIFP